MMESLSSVRRPHSRLIPDYLIDWLILTPTPTRPFAHPLESSHVQVIRSRFVLRVLT
jgi:hypothetical protein